MKKYYLNENMKEMDLEEAIDYLMTDLHFSLDYVITTYETEKQSEMLEILLDSYFTVIEEEDDEDYWEDDSIEREREYRKIQGF